jgi:hypothetical protein
MQRVLDFDFPEAASGPTPVRVKHDTLIGIPGAQFAGGYAPRAEPARCPMLREDLELVEASAGAP